MRQGQSAERNLLLTIEYDGTDFFGWQRQPNVKTVQGTLEQALSTVCGREMKVEGTSRTDAGVHAYGQRATMKGDFGIPTDRVALAVNNRLSGGMRGRGATGPIHIKEVREMPLDFHARFDAKGKTYVYKLDISGRPDVFRRNYYYEIGRPLDARAMRQAAEQITGTHDFQCFQSTGGTPRETTVRTIYQIQIVEGDEEIHIKVTGDGFLYNMVRIITGTLVEVGLGKRNPLELEAVIRGKDRQNAGHTAPPQGLYLAEIYYDLKEVPGYERSTSGMG